MSASTDLPPSCTVCGRLEGKHLPSCTEALRPSGAQKAEAEKTLEWLKSPPAPKPPDPPREKQVSAAGSSKSARKESPAAPIRRKAPKPHRGNVAESETEYAPDLKPETALTATPPSTGPPVHQDIIEGQIVEAKAGLEERAPGGQHKWSRDDRIRAFRSFIRHGGQRRQVAKEFDGLNARTVSRWVQAAKQEVEPYASEWALAQTAMREGYQEEGRDAGRELLEVHAHLVRRAKEIARAEGLDVDSVAKMLHVVGANLKVAVEVGQLPRPEKWAAFVAWEAEQERLAVEGDEEAGDLQGLMAEAHVEMRGLIVAGALVPMMRGDAALTQAVRQALEGVEEQAPTEALGVAAC